MANSASYPRTDTEMSTVMPKYGDALWLGSKGGNQKNSDTKQCILNILHALQIQNNMRFLGRLNSTFVNDKVTQTNAWHWHNCRCDDGLRQHRMVATHYMVMYKSFQLIWDYYTRLMALFSGLPRWAGTRKVKPIWILLKQETVSGSGISWAICKSAPRSRQITMPATHHTVFYRLDALPAAKPTASKHWRHFNWYKNTLV